MVSIKSKLLQSVAKGTVPAKYDEVIVIPL
jgi:hypothetical protein